MNLAKKHLLVVDDNPVNVELMLDLLDDHGFDHVHGISDPREVLEYCQTTLPDLLLLDIRMPHLDGYDVIEQLREHFQQRTPPIIVLTAQNDDATRHRALEMGVRDFLTKPFKQDEVLQRIRNTLNIEHRFNVRDQQADTLEKMVEKRTRALDHQSRTDPITLLPNRRGLNQALREASLAANGAGLLFIAIDKLEDVTRLHGYRITEKLLYHLGESINQLLDERHTLGLWSGSELLVLSTETQAGALNAMAERLLACLVHDQRIDDLLLNVQARIGISREEATFDPERLVHMASISLPQGESLAIRHYTPQLEAQQRHRLHVQQALPGACERGEMFLVYQPKIDLQRPQISGAEALLRWKHPEAGTLSPGLFIPLAEASGDILAIGDWVLEEAIQQISAWRNNELASFGWLSDDFHVAINVAARQLGRKTFSTRLLQRLKAHNVPTRLISIEVTESGLMSDMTHARQQLTQLIKAGVRVAIDDFGTGQSSLAYLKTLPVSTLKIDRAFVMELEESATDRHFCHTITQLAQGVGCDVVAEGIETAGQAEFLRSIGCETGQGYYYSHPLPAMEFARWCAQWTPTTTSKGGTLNGS
ncbi:GGDEF/EAL domain-containing response regulator [Halomonas sp. LS-001]